jgi:hypothetical protein
MIVIFGLGECVSKDFSELLFEGKDLNIRHFHFLFLWMVVITAKSKAAV